MNAKEISAEEYLEREKAVRRDYEERIKEAKRETWEMVKRTAWIVNLAVPPGWLALGAMSLADHAVLPALLATLGMALIGTASLWRLRIQRPCGCTPDSSPRGDQSPPSSALPVRIARRSTRLLEMKLPFVSEQASAIALTGFRSLTRAPEAKMLLLTPIILVIVYAGIFLRQGLKVPTLVIPLMAFGAMAMVLLTWSSSSAISSASTAAASAFSCCAPPLAETCCWARTWPSPRWRWPWAE